MTEEDLTLKQLQERLSSFPDESLLQMRDDIEGDPDAFREHVGLNNAAEFLIALLTEISERGLLKISDPKEPQDSSSIRRSLTRLASRFSREEEEITRPDLPKTVRQPPLNRKERRARKAEARKNAKRRLKK